MKQIFKQNRTKHEESLWWKRALSHPLGRFFFGAAGYGVLELLWRGRTHWSMLLAGGICFLVYYKLCRDSQHMPLFVKCLLGASLITSVELMFGTVVNVMLGMNVWDYTNLPFHFFGQVCLPFFILWFLLCVPLTLLCDFLRMKLGDSA
ncbi:MAG: hypothetical protein IJC78_02255 [Clostridia bacterium]|nr:hypothetical protein [Clostridia bacterium]